MDVLRDAVRVTRAQRPLTIESWVVLPDHFHCVWTLPDWDADYSVRMGAIKARFTRGCKVGFDPTDGDRGSNGMVGWNPTVRRSASKVKKGDSGIWQRRFWEHHIRDERDYQNHVRYCWGNPVKHGYVARAVDWPYSSIHRDVKAGVVESDWSGEVPDGEFGE